MRLIIGLTSIVGLGAFLIYYFLTIGFTPTITNLPEYYNNSAWHWKSPTKIDTEDFEKSVQFAKAKNIKTIHKKDI